MIMCLNAYFNDGKIKNAASKVSNDINKICEGLSLYSCGLINPRGENNLLRLFSNHPQLRK